MLVRHGRVNNNLDHKLEVFHHGCLRKLLKILWQDHVTNDEVCQRSGQWKLSEIEKEHPLKILGHILRIPEERLPNTPPGEEQCNKTYEAWGLVGKSPRL